MARHVPRLYVGAYNLSINQAIALVDNQHHYLIHVLRVQPGAKVILFNEADGEWSCSVETISKTIVKLRVDERLRSCSRLPDTHLYFAPLRKERLMDVLEKGTELGVTHFHPIITDHTVHGRLNMEKLEIYIQDAAEQCGRCDMPQLLAPAGILNILNDWNTNTPLFLALEAETLPPLGLSNTADPAHLAVGPEGGWSEAEKQRFRDLSFVKPFSLGSLTLRAETAAISSMALISYLRTLG
jgi:16S rRNA (uracil1498-N3)-methyltransferase